MFMAQRAAEPTFPGIFGPFRTMVTLSRFAFTKCLPTPFFASCTLRIPGPDPIPKALRESGDP
jgi:hypothetical protein